jgi:hypothetical protein
MIVLMMLQTTVVSTLPLLNGTADLLLLALAAWGLQERAQSAWAWALVAGALAHFVSAAPAFVPLAGYLFVTAAARLLRRRVWQTPVFSMFFVTFAGSLVAQGMVMAVLVLRGVPLPWFDSLNLVILPGTLLNLLLALPVYAVISDLAQWVYPEEVEI